MHDATVPDRLSSHSATTPVDTVRPQDHARSWSVVAAAAIFIGVVFGPFDLAGQVHAPYPFANLFNSPAVWAAVAFAFGVWAGEPRRATYGSMGAMVIAVETYYLADVVMRDANTANLTSPTAFFWLALGVGAALVFGAAGGLATHSNLWFRTTAAALLPAVFASEAAHQLIQHATTDRAASRDDGIQFALLLAVLAAITLVWTMLLAPRSDRSRILIATMSLTIVGVIAYTLVTT